MTIMTEQDMADYMKVRSAREVWIEACDSGADAMDGKSSTGPAIVARDNAAASVIEAALDEARADERRKVVDWLRGMSATEWNDMMAERIHLPWAYGIADAIEKGEHRG